MLILTSINCSKVNDVNRSRKHHSSQRGVNDNKKYSMSKDDIFFNFQKKRTKTDKLLWEPLEKGEKIKCYTCVMTGFESYLIFKTDITNINIDFLKFLNSEGESLKYKIKKNWVYIKVMPFTVFVFNYDSDENLFNNDHYEVYVEKVKGRVIYSKNANFIKKNFGNKCLIYHFKEEIIDSILFFEKLQKKQESDEYHGLEQ